MRKIKDLTGEKFGHLEVMSLNPVRDANKKVVWNCRCECGKILALRGESLKEGYPISCGCLRRGAKSKKPPQKPEVATKALSDYTDQELCQIISKSVSRARDKAYGDKVLMSQEDCLSALRVSLEWRLERYGQTAGYQSWRNFTETLALCHLRKTKEYHAPL